MVPRHLLQALACAAAMTLAGTTAGQAGRDGEFRVNSFVQDGQVYPAVAMNPAGSAVVVWYSQTQDHDTRGVYGQRLDADGNPAGAEFQANTYTADIQDWPTVAISESGRFVVVWTSYGQDGSDAGVFGQLFDPSGNKLFDEFPVNSHTTDRQKYPVVAMDADGGFVVAWQSRYQDGSEDGIYAQRFDNHAQRLGTEFQVNVVTLGYQILPAIAMNPDGNFVIAWTRNLEDGNGGSISMRRYSSDGTPLGGEASVNGYWPDDQSNPAVGMDESGDIVVAWDSFGQDGDSDGIYAQMFYANGQPHGGELHVSTEVAHAQSVPAVAMHASGHFLVFWQSDEQDGSLWGVFGQAFGSDGTPISGEFQFNTYTTEQQMMPAAAIDENGDFLVAWMSNGQDGSGFGIYADYGWIQNPSSVAVQNAAAPAVVLGHPTLLTTGAPARLPLVLSAPSAVDLTLYDTRGALVRCLTRGFLPSGRHEVVWDGVAESGNRAPSGIYFLRARAGRAEVSRRIVVLR